MHSEPESASAHSRFPAEPVSPNIGSPDGRFKARRTQPMPDSMAPTYDPSPTSDDVAACGCSGRRSRSTSATAADGSSRRLTTATAPCGRVCRTVSASGSRHGAFTRTTIRTATRPTRSSEPRRDRVALSCRKSASERRSGRRRDVPIAASTDTSLFDLDAVPAGPTQGAEHKPAPATLPSNDLILDPLAALIDGAGGRAVEWRSATPDARASRRAEGARIPTRTAGWLLRARRSWP